MKLHLVGGFLGSGKTTAIIQASRRLMAGGLRVGVVTNDQGKYLVDTAFVRFSEVPAVEVTGGCFCCNYADLDSSLDQLLHTVQPDIIFAESVGSCADIVATVVKPLLKLKHTLTTPTSFSVFTDSRLLRRRLRGDPMPFSEDVVYIFDKQIEEAGLLVINKTDLLSSEKLSEVKSLVKETYPAKRVISQSSLANSGVGEWLELLEQGVGLLPGQSLDIDYSRYGNGEAQLAWLDEIVILRGASLTQSLRNLISSFLAEIKRSRYGIGHIKFLVQDGHQSLKLSYPTIEDAEWESQSFTTGSQELKLMVNARVEMPADDLCGLFMLCLQNCGAAFSEDGVRFFHPAQPNPTHRYA
jgi:Ni2+-binding GTPase involved in maturation of urease and hydrogenase